MSFCFLVLLSSDAQVKEIETHRQTDQLATAANDRLAARQALAGPG